MKILIISSYPRVDSLAYKEAILTGLVRRDCEIKVIYSGIRPIDYFKEARSRELLNLRSLRSRGAGPKEPGSEARSKLTDVAARNGVEVGSFKTLASQEALSFVERFDPDHGINLSGQFIPSRLIDAVGGRIVGGHYGDLPRFRGRDTVRWPILLDHPTVVSHMYLAKKYDMGDVLLKTTVRVTRGQGLDVIRRACQETSAKGHLAVVDAFKKGQLHPRPQQESEGTTFYEMGAFLKQRVDELLRSGSYESGSEVGS